MIMTNSSTVSTVSVKMNSTMDLSKIWYSSKRRMKFKRHLSTNSRNPAKLTQSEGIKKVDQSSKMKTPVMLNNS